LQTNVNSADIAPARWENPGALTLGAIRSAIFLPRCTPNRAVDRYNLNFITRGLVGAMSLSYRLRVLGLLCAFLPGLAFANTAASGSVTAPGESRVGSIARLLAGVAPVLPSHQEIAQTGEWREHRDAVQSGWAKVKAGRAATMMRWRDENIRPGCLTSGTLLYPFSGPDFYNAHLFFPNCRNYVFFGLELPGEIPDLEKLDRQGLARLLGDVRVAVGDLVERNYFITSRMSKQLHTSQLRGVIPVLIASMALAGLEVRSIEPFELTSQATRLADDADKSAAKPMRKLRAIQVTFQRPGAAQPQTLQYFSVDATNNGLAPYPEFLQHIRGFKQSPMLIKSASYLLQDRQFRNIREALLESADYLVQDDTGMPFDVLKSNGWEVQLFGGYRRPIDPFHWAYQPGLDAAYKSTSTAELPFSFSYHWRDGRSNAMVARRGSIQADASPAVRTPQPR
jgi:hypothetical protein